MRQVSTSHLRKKLAAVLDSVTERHEPVMITRGGRKPPAVLVSLEYFAGFDETAYLLSSPRNAARLAESIAELEAGKGVARDLIG